jgi:hypothetical protein
MSAFFKKRLKVGVGMNCQIKLFNSKKCMSVKSWWIAFIIFWGTESGDKFLSKHPKRVSRAIRAMAAIRK